MLGTNKDNVDDKVSKGRAKGTKTRRGVNSCNAKITQENVDEIRNNPHDKCQCCLARQFDISPQQVSRIQHNERWNVVEIKKSLEDDFWERAIHRKIIINDILGECWETKREKEQFSYKGKSMLSHRIAYMISKNTEIPRNKLIRHKCDNNKCINPEHLLIGTNMENTNDMIERNRICRGDKHHAKKLTDLQIIEIFNQKDLKTPKELAQQYGITANYIRCIFNKTTRKHIFIN